MRPVLGALVLWCRDGPIASSVLIAAAARVSLAAIIAAPSAHPHVWVTMTEELVYAPDGSVTGVRHAWTFDDMFSAFATQGMEQKPKAIHAPGA